MSKRSRALRHYRSYKPRSFLTKLLSTLVKVVVVLFIGYYLVSGFFLRTYQVHTSAGLPQLSLEDRIIATPLPYGPQVPFLQHELPPLRSPERGELVVRSNRTASGAGVTLRIADPLVRFFTLQRVSLLSNDSAGLNPARSVLRVVGLPGDTVQMREYTVYVQPPSSGDFIPEGQLIEREYRLITPPTPPGGGENVPLSGYHSAFTLEEGEYLLMPDNRSFAAASAAWRPTKQWHIVDKVMVRYWPQFTRF